MITVKCPECQTTIKIKSNPSIGEVITCRNCQNVLEIVWLYPLELDYYEGIPSQNPIEEPGKEKTSPNP